MEYYIIIDGRQDGPWAKEDLLRNGLTPESDVWRVGLESWVKASSLEELNDLFVSEIKCDGELPPPYVNGSKQYYAIVNGVRMGPESPEGLVRGGVISTTPVWKEGMPDWTEAAKVEDFSIYFCTPGYSAGISGMAPETVPAVSVGNWMGWAIAATIVNFLTMWAVWFPVVGLVCGILGMVYANDATSKKTMGFQDAAIRVESQSKTMTIVALVIAGVAILGAIVTLFVGLAVFSSLGASL